MRFVNPVLVVFCLSVSLLDAPCASLQGTVLEEETGTRLGKVTVLVYPHGRSVGHTTQTHKDGTYAFTDLPAGNHAIGVGPRKETRAKVLGAVTLEEDKPAKVDFRLTRSLAVNGNCWTQPYDTFYQSFAASGISLTQLLINAFGPAREVTVQVLEGWGPGGAEIGPPRITSPVGAEGTTVIRWANGEVKTVPGHHYTLRMSAPPGQTWQPGVAGLGDVYPGGQAWFGDTARPQTDLGITLCEDADSLVTHYSVAAGLRDHRVRGVSQAFVARGSSVLFASAVLENIVPEASYVRFSIHEANAEFTQVGPSKVTAVGREAAVLWGTGEVPVTPQQTYFLHIESCSGRVFAVAKQPDSYAEGLAVFDGNRDPTADIAATVLGQIDETGRSFVIRHPFRTKVLPLVNPSFEEGMNGWTRAGEKGTVVACTDGIIPMWGDHMFGWNHEYTGEGSSCLVYQRVKVEPGALYSFSMSVYTERLGGQAYDVKARLVAAPDGKQESFGTSAMESSQWYTTETQWRPASVEFRSQSEEVLIGFELEQRWSLEKNNLFVDGAMLQEIENDESKLPQHHGCCSH